MDYQGRVGSKTIAPRRRSGMDKGLLSATFAKEGYEAVFIQLNNVNLQDVCWEGTPVAYCSSEDSHLRYKSYIEDICYGLELRGARVLPSYKYLRAHHNKVFMEELCDIMNLRPAHSIKSKSYGCLEEFREPSDQLSYPVVLKPASGAGSRSVCLAENPADALEKVKKISRSWDWVNDIKEVARSIKYRGFIRDSRHRNKFIAQNLIPGLKNDWKVLVFGDKYYVLRREVRPNDFRASGSGLFTWEKEPPIHVCRYALEVFKKLNVPHVSLDIAWDGSRCHLIEFQAVSFGCLTMERSSWFFRPDGDEWRIVHETPVLENEYVRSMVQFLSRGRS